MPTTIFLPVLVLMIWTLLLFIWFLIDRVKQMRAFEIKPQELATRQQAKELLVGQQLSDHLSNLFEVPILFYILSLMLFVTNHVTTTQLGLAWAYVAFRAMHSAVHCTYNHVIHRAIVFFVSNVILMVMLGLLAYALFKSPFAGI